MEYESTGSVVVAFVVVIEEEISAVVTLGGLLGAQLHASTSARETFVNKNTS
jgi:hypothetical protein